MCSSFALGTSLYSECFVFRFFGTTHPPCDCLVAIVQLDASHAVVCNTTTALAIISECLLLAVRRVVTCISSKQRCFSSDFGELLGMLSEGKGQTPRNSGDRP